jgi:subtilisin family serine protease
MNPIWFIVTFSLALLQAGQLGEDRYVPNEVIVKLVPTTPLITGRQATTGVVSIDAVLDQYGPVSVTPLFPVRTQRRTDLPDISRIYRVEYSVTATPPVVAAHLTSLPEVEYAEPNWIFHEMEVPDDPFYGNQWHLTKIAAAAAWDVSHGDTNVVVAIVDGSFDLQHEDLADNWFTNWAEYFGQAGVDDDGNGYVDDIRGWDFVYNDNDPNYGHPDNTHGTHVAGIINAVTDNSVGIAGVAWNVTMLPLKCGLDEPSTAIINGYSAMVYAAEMGADIINNSWGGGGYTQFGEDIVAYVTGLGSLVIAAAGNNNSDGFFQPAGLQQVLSVAATNSSDYRASFSNYGLTVDVAAPGVSILSTLTQNGYGNLSGTSMASPVVSGLAALVKSVYPDLTPYELAFRIAATADNIDGQNPDFAGLLGSGRVNASQAVTFDSTQFIPIPPRIDGWVASANDTVAGNANGIFDRGETVHVSGVFRNFSLGDASTFQVRLATAHPDLMIIDSISGEYIFPHDAELAVTNELSFLVDDSAEAGMAELELRLYIDGEYHHSYPLYVLIGKTPVLLVDDDTGDWNMEGFYTGVMDELEVRYGIWDHAHQGAPSTEVLNAFPIVLWMCEWAFPSLDGDDRAALRGYLDNGGNLYLSGQDVGWDLNLNPGTEDQTSFYRDYLHAVWGGDDAGVMHAEGIPADPIGNGLSFDFWQPGYPSSYQYPDYFSPDSGAELSFVYDNGLGMGLRYSGDYRLVYTGIGLETFGSDINSLPPEDINDVQRTALSRILSYLNFLHHEAYTDVEDTTSSFPVIVDINGDLNDLLSVDLYYRFDTMTDFVQMSMADSGGGRFTGTIPAPGMATSVEYYIEISSTYYRWSNPVGAPGNVFRFFAGPDTVAPVVLSVTELADRIDRSGAEEIVAYVMDNIAVDSVFLNWSTNLDPNFIRHIPMEFDGQAWRGTLSWDYLPGNTVITYTIEAVDQSAAHNSGFSEPYSFRIINTALLTTWDDQVIGAWDTGESWGLQYINVLYGYGMNDSPGGQYANNADNSLTLLEPWDLSPYNSAYLQFWSGAFLRPDEDFGYVELSADGANWETVVTITGMGMVDTLVVDVSDYIDTGVYVRFRMTSDDQNTAVGWFVDDIHLLVDTTIVLASEPMEILPTDYRLSQNYPNPFNPVTQIQFSLPQRDRVTITIYDLMGREVTTLFEGTLPAGVHHLRWDGTNRAGEPVGAGVYFYRLTTPEFTRTRKMILLK